MPPSPMEIKAVKFIGDLDPTGLEKTSWPADEKRVSGVKFKLPYETQDEQSFTNAVYMLLEDRLTLEAPKDLRHGVQRTQTAELVTLTTSRNEISFSIEEGFLGEVQKSVQGIGR